ncbi:MAG: LytTR family DNA-binding domain-containing protein [Burkholderiaceae bacterium]|nr:LytTR family DNA-binding domain-containing protein [Burkholderiaceae bacterium]
MGDGPSALIADDEPMLREAMARLLAELWPDLRIVAQARNGREAIALFEQHRPEVCFLDVQMPGQTGIEAARVIGTRAHLVFVTAFDQYAVEAFARGALDYLVKPVERERLRETVERLRERLRNVQPPPAATDELIRELAARLAQAPREARLRWLRAGSGQATRLIPVEEIDFLRADEKYTLVGWRGDGTRPGEALVRTPLKELAGQLDPDQFVQVHRSVIVNLGSVSHVTRGLNETATIHLKGRPETLPVSRAFVHLFRQM